MKIKKLLKETVSQHFEGLNLVSINRYWKVRSPPVKNLKCMHGEIQYSYFLNMF